MQPASTLRHGRQPRGATLREVWRARALCEDMRPSSASRRVADSKRVEPSGCRSRQWSGKWCRRCGYPRGRGRCLSSVTCI